MGFLLTRFEYGDSVVNYFIFALCMLVYNIVIFTASLGTIIPHYIFTSYNINSTYIEYVSMSTTESTLSWRIIATLLIGLSVAFPFLYVLIARLANEYDISHNKPSTRYTCKLIIFNILIYLIMFIILGINTLIYIGVNYLTLLYINKTIISLILSVILYISNYSWYYINVLSNKFNSLNSYDHMLFKELLYRLINVYSVTMTSQITNNSCVIDTIALQVISNLIVDLTLNNFKEIVYMIYISRRKIEEFNPVEEYYEFIYRQYMIYLSITACPIVTVIGIISSICEIIIDYIKVKFYIKTSSNTYPNIYTIFTLLLICALLAIINPISGNVYMMIGKGFIDNYSKCKVFNY